MALASSRAGRPFAILAFAISGGMIVEVDVIADRTRLKGLHLAGLEN